MSKSHFENLPWIAYENKPHDLDLLVVSMRYANIVSKARHYDIYSFELAS